MQINKEILREIFNYENGFLFWKKKSSDSSHIKVGDLAGCYKRKYATVCVFGKHQKVHRMIWIYHNGDCDSEMIDHKNGDTQDNRIENLRPVSRSQNACNAKIRSDNKSGFTGVKYNKKSKKWEAQISYKKKRIYLGGFEKIEDAIVARKSALHIQEGFHRQ